MARLIALEWDSREARIALGRTRGKELTVEQAFNVELGGRESGEAAAETEPKAGERIATALAARGVTGGEVLVAVGRTNLELRSLQLPPAPDEELPDIVRFQAMRQFAAIGEDWPVDFYPLSRSGESINVLAAAISPELVAQIRQTCTACGLAPQHLVLRPFAAAALLRRVAKHPSDRRCLMVDVLADEADLTVLEDGQVVFMRTVRLASQAEAPAQIRALVGEIRRTSVAAQNQMGGRRVELVVVCGERDSHAELKAAIETQMSVDVELFDPFAAASLSRELKREPPANPGRYASLLGMLADEAEGAIHSIDFLHPRQRPKPPDRRRQNILVVALAASLLLAVLGYGWMQLQLRDRRIASLKQQATALDARVLEAQKLVRDLGEIKQFAASDITWLDEIRELAQELPPAEDAILTQVTLAERTPSGGQIILEGYVREAPMIHKMEQGLTDKYHRVFGDRGNLDARRDTYQWQFRERILVEPEGELAEAAAANEAVAPAPQPGAPVNGQEDGDPSAAPEDRPPQASNSNTASVANQEAAL